MEPPSEESKMRTVKVHHELLPHIDERFELATASGLTLTVVCHRSGRRDLGLRLRGADRPEIVAALSSAEAAAVASLLTGAYVEFHTARA
jgi:K+/H+ antiporter YhaU regulatory subunit KhtT